MNTIELKFNEKLLNTLKSRIKFVGTGSIKVKGDGKVFVNNSYTGQIIAIKDCDKSLISVD